MKMIKRALKCILLIDKAEKMNAVVNMLINVPEITSNSIVPFLMQIWCRLNKMATAISKMKSSNTARVYNYFKSPFYLVNFLYFTTNSMQ